MKRKYNSEYTQNKICEIFIELLKQKDYKDITIDAITEKCGINRTTFYLFYYNYPNTGRPGSNSKFTSRYLDIPFAPLYPFGYGLSYTTFKYDDMEVKEEPESINVSVAVENTGEVTGTETIQLYMRDITASIVRPVKELKGFKKVVLNPGEKKKVSINILKEDMGFYNNCGEYIVEDGKFNLYIGGNSKECLEKEITINF